MDDRRYGLQPDGTMLVTQQQWEDLLTAGSEIRVERDKLAKRVQQLERETQDLKATVAEYREDVEKSERRFQALRRARSAIKRFQSAIEEITTYGKRK